MLVRAVTKAWEESLDGPPSIGRVYQPNADRQQLSSASVGWCRPDTTNVVDHAANDDVGPEQRATIAVQAEQDAVVRANPKIIPKRRVVAIKDPPEESLWTSYEFWMGIVVGAGAVLVVKTVLAVQAPFGVTWY